MQNKRVEIKEFLYYYNIPLCFIGTIDTEQFLFWWLEPFDDYDTYIMVKSDSSTIKELESNLITILDCFKKLGKDELWVVNIYENQINAAIKYDFEFFDYCYIASQWIADLTLNPT